MPDPSLAAHVPSEAYWSAESTARLPRRAGSAGQMVVAIVVDDADLTAGGPQFAGGHAAVAPVTPSGMPEVAIRSDPAPGAFRAEWERPEHLRQRRLRRQQCVRRWTKRACVVVLVGAAAFAAYPRLHAMIVARSVAPDLRAYVADKGVTYAPAADGYAMRFPKAPAVANGAAPVAMHTAVAVGADYRVAVWDAALPPGGFANGAPAALRDPEIGGPGTLTAMHPTEIAAEPAYVGTFTASNAAPRRVAVIVHGGRFFVIRVQAAAASTVFAAAAHSFRFTR